MHYIKLKREKKSICNLCRQEKDLTWDHVPPKGGIKLQPVQIQTVLSYFGGEKDGTGKIESQNGVKYRTICKKCNDFMGEELDSTLNDFAISVGVYPKTKLIIPDVIGQRTKPQRLLKAILGHLVAAKVDIENTSFDKAARDYVLDLKAPLPHDINVFYWLYPFNKTIVIRDFAMFTPRGTFQDPAVFQTLKYYPVGYLCSTAKKYADLESLSQYGNCGLDDEITIPIRLNLVHEYHWPEAPSDADSNVFFGGQSAMKGVHATPQIKARVLSRIIQRKR